jgi:hypothetical protein
VLAVLPLDVLVVPQEFEILLDFLKKLEKGEPPQLK